MTTIGSTATIQRTLDQLLRAEEPQLVRFLFTQWDEQNGDIGIPDLEEALLNGDLPPDVWSRWNNRYSNFINRRMVPTWSVAAEQGASRLARDLARLGGAPSGFQTDVFPRVDRWMQRRGGELAVELTTTQRGALRNLLRHWARQDQAGGPIDLARFIRPAIGMTSRQQRAVNTLHAGLLELVEKGEMTRAAANRQALRRAFQLRAHRAERIARTEVSFAFNQGMFQQVQADREAGNFIGTPVKVWQTAEDERVDCKLCKPVNGDKVPMDAEFDNGFSLPPAHPFCRCTITYELEGGLADLVEENPDPAAPSPTAKPEDLIDNRPETLEAINTARQEWLKAVGANNFPQPGQEGATQAALDAAKTRLQDLLEERVLPGAAQWADQNPGQDPLDWVRDNIRVPGASEAVGLLRSDRMTVQINAILGPRRLARLPDSYEDFDNFEDARDYFHRVLGGRLIEPPTSGSMRSSSLRGNARLEFLNAANRTFSDMMRTHQAGNLLRNTSLILGSLRDSAAFGRASIGDGVLGVASLRRHRREFNQVRQTARDRTVNPRYASGRWTIDDPWSAPDAEVYFQSTLRHELGHNLTERQGVTWFQDAYDAMRTDIRARGGLQWARQNLSEYGASNWYEFIAESTAWFTSPQYDGSLPESVEMFLVRMMQGPTLDDL